MLFHDGDTTLQVTKKSSHERFPSMAKYSDRSRAEDASHTVSLDTEFRCISNPDEVISPEDRVKAYKVGSCCQSLSFATTATGEHKSWDSAVASQQQSDGATLSLAMSSNLLQIGQHKLAHV